MAVFDHWHPVLPFDALRKQPAAIQLAGRRIALFRTAPDALGALDDCCPHRRARLSLGTVVGERLQCRYHAWTFDRHGAGESPGTPKLRACAVHYDTALRYGFVWIKAAGVEAKLPEFDVEGYESVGVLTHQIDAPLEVVLDNFTEVEHTPTTHANFGYELARMSEVETRVETTDSTVRVVNSGPQKRTPWVVAALAGLRSGDRFVDDWTTHFSPVYTVYDQWWSDPQTGAERPQRWRIYVFFNPIDEQTTQLVTFPYLRTSTRSQALMVRLTRPALRSLVNLEVVCDVKMLDALADKRPGLEGMKLSRFDRVLGLNRDRIERIYRGNTNGHPRSAPETSAPLATD